MADTLLSRGYAAGVDQPFVVRLAAPRAAHEASALLSAADRRRLSSISAPERRAAHATGRVLLHELVAELSGQPVGTVAITTRCPRCGSEQHGRPQAGTPRLHLSLAHAPGVVLAAVADRPCGVDVERLEDANRLADAARVVLSPKEIRDGHGTDPTSLLRTWVRKEALLKAWGSGLQVRPEDVSLCGDDSPTRRPVNTPGGLPRAEVRDLTIDDLTIDDLTIDDLRSHDLVAAVCLVEVPSAPR